MSQRRSATVKTRAASVLPSIDAHIVRLAEERQWTPSKTAGWLIEKGLEAEGILKPQPKRKAA